MAIDHEGVAQAEDFSDNQIQAHVHRYALEMKGVVQATGIILPPHLTLDELIGRLEATRDRLVEEQGPAPAPEEWTAMRRAGGRTIKLAQMQKLMLQDNMKARG